MRRRVWNSGQSSTAGEVQAYVSSADASLSGLEGASSKQVALGTDIFALTGMV